MADDLNLRIVLRAIDQVSAPLRRIGAGVRRIGRETGLARVGAAAFDVGRGLGRVGREALLTARRIGLVGAAGATGLAALVNRFTRLGDSIAKVADRLGIPIEELQQLHFAGQLAGIGVQDMDANLRRFTRRIGEAIKGGGEAYDTLREMGIALLDSTGALRPITAILGDVADAMATMPNQTAKTTAAFKLFDSEGIAMVNVLGGGSEGFHKMMREADRFGLVTKEQAREMEGFRDDLTKLGAAFGGIGKAISAELVPHLSPLIQYFTDLAASSRPDALKVFREILADVSKFVRWLREDLPELVDDVEDFAKKAEETVPGLRKLREWLQGTSEEMGWTGIIATALGLALGGRLVLSVARLFKPLATLTWHTGEAVVKLGGLAKKAAGKIGPLRTGGVVRENRRDPDRRRPGEERRRSRRSRRGPNTSDESRPRRARRRRRDRGRRPRGGCGRHPRRAPHARDGGHQVGPCRCHRGGPCGAKRHRRRGA